MKAFLVDSEQGFRTCLAKRAEHSPLMLNLFPSDDVFLARDLGVITALVVAKQAGAPTLNEAVLALLKVLG